MNGECELTVGRTEEGYLVRLAGRGTMQQSPSLRDFVCGALDDGASVAVDLSECTFLDSTSLGCLVVLHKRADTNDGTFTVIVPEEKRSQFFGSCHLDQVLTLHAEPPELTSDTVDLPTTDLERDEFGRHLLETHEELVRAGGPQMSAFQSVVERLRKELG